MAKNKKIAGNPELDATMPETTIMLNGQTYYLAFTFGALSIAERKLALIGQNINMFEVIDWTKMNASALEVMLFAALQSHHPELSFELASRLLTLKNFGRVHKALIEAYVASMSELDPDSPNPTEELAAE